MRDKSSSREGLKMGNLWLTVDELEELADEATEIAGLVMTFDFALTRPDASWGGVTDRLEVVDGQVRRRPLGDR
jgi:hypothetical protein